MKKYAGIIVTEIALLACIALAVSLLQPSEDAVIFAFIFSLLSLHTVVGWINACMSMDAEDRAKQGFIQ